MRDTTIALFCALALAGCATTLDAEGCRNANWEKIGQRDGSSGQGSRLQAHAAACEPHGVKPDAAAYGKGLDVGRAQYATTMQQRRVSLF